MLFLSTRGYCNAGTLQLEDPIGAGDGREQRVHRQMLKEAELDNVVVMLDRNLEGAESIKKHLRRSPFIQRWAYAHLTDNYINTPPQLSFMFCP